MPHHNIQVCICHLHGSKRIASHRKVLDYLLPFVPEQGKIFNPGLAITHPATKPLTSMPQITEFGALPWYTIDGRTTSFLDYTCTQANNKNLHVGASPTIRFDYKTESTLQNPRNQCNKQALQGRTRVKPRADLSSKIT